METNHIILTGLCLTGVIVFIVWLSRHTKEHLRKRHEDNAELSHKNIVRNTYKKSIEADTREDVDKVTLAYMVTHNRHEKQPEHEDLGEEHRPYIHDHHDCNYDIHL